MPTRQTARHNSIGNSPLPPNASLTTLYHPINLSLSAITNPEVLPILHQTPPSPLIFPELLSASPSLPQTFFTCFPLSSSLFHSYCQSIPPYSSQRRSFPFISHLYLSEVSTSLSHPSCPPQPSLSSTEKPSLSLHMPSPDSSPPESSSPPSSCHSSPRCPPHHQALLMRSDPIMSPKSVKRV
ncbi:uncharacterized protein LOC123515868 [Portunus trituberculatus]|uniref:uncharacterized protein LOC123515868 n=1 Tax=Portunus trituberculatus TaxID=210409 RepID=UPI001E1CD60A|nr:uncharacterized protein LOC123515868 [Portunus trituberculatus]